MNPSRSQRNEPPSPLTNRHKSPTPRSKNSPPDHRMSFGSPPYFDLRSKLARRRSASRSRSGSPLSRRSTKSSSVRSNRSVTKLVHSKLKSDRSRSRSPTRSSRRQASRSPRRRTPSPRSRSRSPQFRTPYLPQRKSGEVGERSSSKIRSERSSSRLPKERSSSLARNDRSSSRLPRESSSRLPEKSRPRSKERKSSSHRVRSSPHSTTTPRIVVESSPEYQPTPSTPTVVAGVDVDTTVNKMLQKIVAKTAKNKKGKKKEKMELVLRKAKKKKSRKVRPVELLKTGQVKAEPVTDHEPPPPTMVHIKTEPGVAPPPPPAAPATPSHQYFKPQQEIELQPILGHSKCRICKSYFPDTDDRRNQHLAQHPDRVFVVNLPVDTFYYDMEEAISHLAKFGIDRVELQQKVKDCNLIKLPTNLIGFSCDICKMLDTNIEKEFNIHVKEECKVMAKEERAQHLVSFCRGCHARFRCKSELQQHVGVGGCWPSMMVVNRLYDMSVREVVAKPRDKAVIDKEKMVRVKQEKLERAQQIQIKRERFETDRDQVLPQLPPVPSSPQQLPKFNALSLPSSQESLQAASNAAPSTSELQQIMKSLQSNQAMQSLQATSYMQQLDMANMQGIQQLPQIQFPPPSFVPQLFQMPVNFSIPPPNFPPNPPHPASSPRHSQPPPSHTSSADRVKTERGATSPRLSHSHLLEQSKVVPSPSFSHRSRSRRPSVPVVVPPPPSTPLPTLDDLFPAGGSSGRNNQEPGRRQRYPSGDSIASCDSFNQQASQSIKLVSTSNCQRSACLWTDPHSTTCSKLPIMTKCSTDSCNWFDLHRDNPLCDKLSFYCNCKKESEGVYKYYDNLPQVRRIPTEMEGNRDSSVKEPKNVVMRLLYRTVSKVAGDPRLSKSNYPNPRNIPARSFRGKGGRRRGWKENCVICTWSGVSMVQVRCGDNPHIVSDHDSDVEFCEEESGRYWSREDIL